MTEQDLQAGTDIANLKGSLDMVNTALELVGDVEITIKDHPKVIQAYVWLNTLRDNMEKELKLKEPDNHTDAGTVADPHQEDDGGTD